MLEKIEKKMIPMPKETFLKRLPTTALSRVRRENFCVKHEKSHEIDGTPTNVQGGFGDFLGSTFVEGTGWLIRCNRVWPGAKNNELSQLK